MKASKWTYEEIKENFYGISLTLDKQTAARRKKGGYKRSYSSASGEVTVPACDVLLAPQVKSMIKKIEVSARVKCQVEATNHNEIWQLLSQVHEKFKPVTGPSTVCG